MKFFSQQHTYHHDWETVTAALWQKYPNPLQPHVQRVDTIDRLIDKNNCSFHVLRLLSLKYNVPSWIQALVRRPPVGYGLEHATCTISPKPKLTLKSSNITFSRFLKVDETCEYIPHPDNPEKWTLFTQKAQYRINGFGLVTSALETVAIQTSAEKAKAGLEAMQSIIHRLEEESRQWKNVRQRFELAKSSFESRFHESCGNMEHKVHEAKTQVEKTVTACLDSFSNIAKHKDDDKKKD